MNELIQKILEYVNTTELFLKDQLPDFINQYLTWCYYESLFWLLFHLSVLIILTVAAIKLYYKDWFEDEPTPRAIAFFSSAIVAVIFLFVNMFTVPDHTLKLIKISKAPKVFLVEKLAGVIKK
jgi:hypothetical protein